MSGNYQVWTDGDWYSSHNDREEAIRMARSVAETHERVTLWGMREGRNGTPARLEWREQVGVYAPSRTDGPHDTASTARKRSGILPIPQRVARALRDGTDRRNGRRLSAREARTRGVRAMERSTRLAEQLDGARVVRTYIDAGVVLAWHGGHGVHVYYLDGEEADFYNVGSFAQDAATEEDVRDSMEQYMRDAYDASR